MERMARIRARASSERLPADRPRLAAGGLAVAIPSRAAWEVVRALRGDGAQLRHAPEHDGMAVGTVSYAGSSPPRIRDQAWPVDRL
jgi:hypothetical protein